MPDVFYDWTKSRGDNGVVYRLMRLVRTGRKTERYHCVAVIRRVDGAPESGGPYALLLTYDTITIMTSKDAIDAGIKEVQYVDTVVEAKERALEYAHYLYRDRG